MGKKEIIFISLLIVILFGIFWQTFDYELVWDSDIFFNKNPSFLENRSLLFGFESGYFKHKFQNRGHYYRPLTISTFLIENKIWGIQNISLRLINLLIYGLGLIFLYLFLKQQPEKQYFPEITTLIFALFPLNLDNVVWVVGRGDLLLFLWGALTFLFLGYFIKKGRSRYLLYSSLFYLLGILSKEAFFFFFPVLIVYEYVKRKKISGFYHLANFSITALFFYLKIIVLGIKNLKMQPFFPPIENIKLITASLGYYFKSILFPFFYDRFLLLREINNWEYLAFGIGFLSLFLSLAYLSQKDTELMIPLSLILFFVGGHLVLLFTSLYPFTTYSRYMMIPALGFIWILAKYINRIQKEKLKFSVVFVILLLFIPSVILNAYSYRSEIHFWKRAYKLSPKNGYILYKISKQLHNNKDYLAAELYLNKTLNLSIKKETGILVSLLYADIEYQRADYEKALRWIKSIKDLERKLKQKISPSFFSKINFHKALILFSKGQFSEAEKLLLQNIQMGQNLEASYHELYNIYMGQKMWQKAQEIENTMAQRFSSTEFETQKLQTKFDSLGSEEKLKFYIRFRNYLKAIKILEEKVAMDLDKKLLLAKLYYWTGNEKKGEILIKKIHNKHSNEFQVLNKIGYFYLKALIRVKKALPFFEESLEINKDQPEVLSMYLRLREGYLKKLSPVWPEEKNTDR